MFWLFAILVLVNGTVDNEKVILRYRIDVGGMPINILDLGLGLMFIFAVASLNRAKFQVDRTHPALKWSLAVLIGSFLLGIFGAVRNDVELRYWATIARNVMTLPLCIFLGYHLIRTPRQVGWAAYFMVAASLGSAIFALLFVRETGEQISGLTSCDRLRSTSYGGDLGLSAMAVLAFGMVAGARIFPTWVSLMLIPLAGVGYFSVPHRSNWVVGALTLVYAAFFLPRVKFGRRVSVSLALAVGLALCMFVAVGMYSRMTGRDFGEYVAKRLQSLLPGDELGGQRKAWASRLPGAKREFAIWMQNPAMGQGFGIQMEEEATGRSSGYGSFRHNVWTASLAESGIFGLLGYTLPPLFAMVIGYRLVRQAGDRGTLFMGALGSVVGCAALLFSPLTLSINIQRVAIPVGLACGMVFKTRAMQLTAAHQQGYLDPGDIPGMPLDAEYQPGYDADYPGYGRQEALY